MRNLLLVISVFSFTFLNAQSGLLNGTGYAPDITVTDINGNSHNLYSYLGAGKMVVLEMLSTTCGTCLMYTSGTENSYQVYGPNGLDVAEFIGLEVNTSTTDNDISNFISNYNVSFPVCNDISPVAINYQLYYTPSYYVIYPDSSYTTICPMYCNDNSSYTTIEGLLNSALQAGLPPVYGCTDSNAQNYDSNATVNDGSCNYTSYDIKTLGMSFSPDTIVCDVGDTINFILGSGHNAVEVTDSIWLSGGNTPISGGFSFGYGATGMFIPDDCHTFYYVCSPHAAYGMKGVIIAHHPPVWGCTDSLATNYDPLANHDDTTCVYYNCNDDTPTNLNVTNIIHDRVIINWDNMNSSITTATTHYINSGNYYYTPSTLTINAGDTVIWINDGGYHNVNFDVSSVTGQSYNNPESFITSPTISSYMASYVFTIPGNYSYDCSVGSHAANGMVGTIQVNPATNSTCIVDQYRIRYRPLGASSWFMKTMGAPVGSCNNPAVNTSKLLLNLNPSTTYEYQMKAWYCGGSSSIWSSIYNFTTSPDCDNVINVTATPDNTTKTTFCWDTVSTYSFVRLQYRENVPGSSFSNIGGFGVFSPLTCKSKNGLTPGTQYRVMWRTWCSATGGPYRSPQWDGPVIWNQPSSIRISDANTEDRKLLKIVDILGREVNPNEEISNTSLFYIYDDGSVEKKIIIE